MSQVELSERVGKSQEWASNVETGKIKAPRLDTLRTLASALQTDPVELVVAAGYTTVPSSARQLLSESQGVAEAESQYDDATRISREQIAAMALEIDWDEGRYNGVLAMFRAFLKDDRRRHKQESPMAK